MSETAVAMRQEQAPAAIETGNVLSILNRVITDPNLPMERVNQAFDFYERIERRNAKIAFDEAIAEAKGKLPQIERDRTVTFGSNSYKHETLAGIAEQVTPVLAEFGLTYRFRTRNEPNQPITVTCIISHKMGHFEENTLSAMPDNGPQRNPIQALGSTVTYLQRYTLKASLGLAAAYDDDGSGGNGGEKPKKSSAAAKRDGTDKKFNEIKTDFETATSMDHLKHLGETWADDIAEMPARWADLLRDTYEVMADEFRARAS